MRIFWRDGGVYNAKVSGGAFPVRSKDWLCEVFMELMTQRDRIRTIATRWEYAYKGGISVKFGQDKADILDRLKQLDLETVDAKTVNEIIGNNTWTIAECSECKRIVKDVVMVGEQPDYESNTAYLCKKCAERAWSLFT
jgi:hypothetical protein